MVLPIDHQYYEYRQVHELIGDKKNNPAFCKQYCSANCRPAFGRHSLINKLKKDNEAYKPWAGAAGALKLLPSDACLLSLRSSTTSALLRTGARNNLKKFVSFALKYVHAIPMHRTRADGESVNSKVQESG